MAPAKSKKLRKGRGLGVDFKKVKHKVGRKLAPSSNATKVDVRSKAIVLPGQSVGQEKEGLSISSRRLTLKELLMQTTHHNDIARRDSLLGIKNLLSRHPKELSLHAATIIEKLCPRISDKSKIVRQALLDLIQTTVFPGMSEVLVRPLVPVIMAYIFSAMTTLTADVRMSAFRFLEVVISSCPILITADYVIQIIESFVNFLGKLGIAGQTSGQLPEMLNILLQFLSAYLKMSRLSNLTFSPSTKESPMAEKNCGAFRLPLHWYKNVVPDLASSLRMHGDKNIQEQGFPLPQAEALVKALSNCWAECAPLVCSGQSPDKDSMECMIKVCAAMHLLVTITEPNLEQKLHRVNYTEENSLPMHRSGSRTKGPIVSKWIEEKMVPFVRRHIIGSFPVFAPPINLPKKIEELLLYLNINILNVVLGLIIACNPQLNEEDCNVSRILDYFEDALDGRMLSSLGLSPESAHKKTMDSYLRLLVPFVPCLIGCMSKERQFRILKAFTNVLIGCKSTSKLKHICLSCIAEILQPSNKERLGHESLETVIFDFQKQWLQMLPKLLWELKASHHASSLTILKVLHHLGRSALQGSLLAEEFMALQPMMIPFFSTAQFTKLNEVPRKHGPFLKLPYDCQNLAIDLLFYYDRFSSVFVKAIAHVLCPDLEVISVVRCIEVVRAVYNRGSLELPDYLSFIMTVCLEAVTLPDDCKHSPLMIDSKTDRAPLYRRQRIIMGALCSCLRQVGDQRLVLHLLHPSICSLMASSLSTWTSYGLIRIICMLGASRNRFFVPKALFELLPAFLNDYLVSLTLECCFKERPINGNELLICPFISPCLCILMQSVNLTERVLHHLCSPSNDGTSHIVYARIAVLIKLVEVASVRSRMLVDSSLLQRFEGDCWLDIFQLQEDNVLSLFQTISQSLTCVYGWDKASNHDAAVE